MMRIKQKTTHRPLLALWVISGLLAGCGQNFLPVSLLDGPRLLAIVATPVEVGAQDESMLQPVWYVPEGMSAIEHHWTFCPYNLGSQTGFRCAFPACVQDVPPQTDGSIRTNAANLLQQCISSMSGSPLGGTPAQVPASLEVSYEYRAVLPNGNTNLAVFRQKLWMDQSPQANQNPVISKVFIGQTNVTEGGLAEPVAPGGTTSIRVLVDPMSLDLYQDGTGAQIVEEPIVYFYSSAGRFDADLAAGSDSTVNWKAEQIDANQHLAMIYVVVRDLRGGQAVAGPFELPIRP